MIRAWFLALRPKTLTAALAPILVATALAYSLDYEIRYALSAWALLASLFIQFGTNLVNDAADFQRGTDNAERLGPQRVTHGGLLSARAVLRAAYLCFFLALLCGIPLILSGGKVILLIGLLSILFAYTYTGGPFPLAYHGLGELFVIIFFGLVAVGGLFFLQSGVYFSAPGVAGLQVGLLAAALIAVNNLRDFDGDKKNSKRTLAVIFGKKSARIYLSFFLCAPFILGLYWWIYLFKLRAFLAPLLLLPFALRITARIWRTEPSRLYNEILAQTALLHLLFGICLAAGLAASRSLL